MHLRGVVGVVNINQFKTVGTNVQFACSQEMELVRGTWRALIFGNTGICGKFWK